MSGGVGSDALRRVLPTTTVVGSDALRRVLPTTTVVGSDALRHVLPTTTVVGSDALRHVLPTTAVVGSDAAGRVVPTTAVVGVDGAPGGWVAATRTGAQGFTTFRALLDAHPGAAIFVDIPIHLLEDGASGYRACDREAKRALGPRGGSVFVPPLRSQLALADERYQAGLGIAAQTHGILSKIREVDAHRFDPRLHEAHPELAFLLADHGTPLAPKRTVEGREQRARILARLHLRFEETGLGVRATRADLDDAAILVWLGEEALAGRVGCYGAAPMVIWGRAQSAKRTAQSGRP